ncbi:hypothetical protein PPACK8108_LOCUS20301 [Phakopsora pachyrhizi]|uniref:Uncharacterized protein n=1 Tax=Phakopsora pachyrhizi TaxID=170000 RepID=A0AAV0BGK1_PHAPC|nr:hypothetical protein PPACK8108_LOCUS20301 [Phakopsora pachyrhizi]
MASICIPFLLRLESPHTALLQNWIDIVDPPFDAPALLISLQTMILTKMFHLLKAKWLALLPPNVVHGVVKILLDIIRAEGKSSLDQPSDGSVSTTVGALMGATNTSLDRMAGVLSGDVGSLSGPGFISTYPQIPGVRPSVVPDETCVATLSRTQNNLNLATEFLLASPVLVQRARDEESAQSQTDTGTNGLPVEADSSDSVDVLMGKASIAGPSSEIMGDVESFTHDKGDDILATPKASEKLSPWLGPKSTGPDEIKAWMILCVLALSANNSMFEASLQQHAAALFALIIKLLQKAHLLSDLLEDEDKLRGAHGSDGCGTRSAVDVVDVVQMIDSKGVVENFDDDDCGGGLVDGLKITVGCCCWSPCLVLLVAFVKQVQVRLVV